MLRRILIIDDDKELCAELSEILKEEGFAVDYAFEPEQGNHLLQGNTYDILLLDFKMPQVNGIDLLKQIKVKARSLKIFLISGSLHLAKLLEEDNLSSFVSGIFNKPFDIDMLLRELRR